MRSSQNVNSLFLGVVTGKPEILNVKIVHEFDLAIIQSEIIHSHLWIFLMYLAAGNNLQRIFNRIAHVHCNKDC